MSCRSRSPARSNFVSHSKLRCGPAVWMPAADQRERHPWKDDSRELAKELTEQTYFQRPLVRGLSLGSEV